MLSRASLKLPLHFRQFRGGLAVFRVRGAVRRLDQGKVLPRQVQIIAELGERVALRGNLLSGQRAGLDGIPGRFLVDPVRLGAGIFRIQLEQARREDIRLLIGIDDVQILFELRKRQVGLLHLRLQLIELLFHEGRQVGRGLDAQVVGVREIRLGDGVGHVRC